MPAGAGLFHTAFTTGIILRPGIGHPGETGVGDPAHTMVNLQQDTAGNRQVEEGKSYGQKFFHAIKVMLEMHTCNRSLLKVCNYF